MTTPGEEPSDEVRPADQEIPDELVENVPKKTKETTEDPILKAMLQGDHYRHLGKFLALGLITVVGGGTYLGLESTLGHHSSGKKPSKSTPEPESVFPDSTFVANFDIDQLNQVIDEKGRVKGDFTLPNLRVDEFNMTARCEATDRTLFSVPQRTIVAYKSNKPKTDFSQFKPTIKEQTSIADISRYSVAFPDSFSDNGQIGTENAQEIAKSVHPDPCEGQGSLWGYQDQQITSLIPNGEVASSLPSSPKDVLGPIIGIILIFGISGGGGYVGYRILKKKLGLNKPKDEEHKDNDEKVKPEEPDVARAEHGAQDGGILNSKHQDEQGYGFTSGSDQK